MPSILVVELTRLGDVICTFRSLARLRAAYPAASLTCVVQEPYAKLLEALDLDIRAIGLTSSQTVGGIVAGLGRIPLCKVLISYHRGREWQSTSWIILARGGWCS